MRNNNGADPCGLMSNFVHCLSSGHELFNLKKDCPVSVSGFQNVEQDDLSLVWSGTPKTGFLMTRLGFNIHNVRHR